MMHTLFVDSRQLATILAALRYWQRVSASPDCAEVDIADNSGTLTPLSPGEIDSLCVRINPSSTKTPLERLKDKGLTIGECIRAFSSPADDSYVVAAHKMVAYQPAVSIDVELVTSKADRGAWVLSWLWVSNEAAGVEETPTEAESPVAHVAEIDVSSLEMVQGKRIHPDFATAARLLKRPYTPISKEAYDAILEKALEADSDILLFNGAQATFGNADGGYALMPLSEPI